MRCDLIYLAPDALPTARLAVSIDGRTKMIMNRGKEKVPATAVAPSL